MIRADGNAETYRRAQGVVDVLGGLDVNDSLAVLIGVVLSYVVSLGDDGEVIQAIADALPQQYAEALAMMAYTTRH